MIFGRPKKAKDANKRGSRNGTKNESMENRLDVENGPAADPGGSGSVVTGKDIGRGKPLPME